MPNRKQVRTLQAGGKVEKPICIQQDFYSVAEADALAVAQKNQGNLQAAVEIYAVILSAFPGLAEIYNNLGNVLFLMRQYAMALASYRQALTLKPNHAEAWFNQGKALQELGRHADALASYDTAFYDTALRLTPETSVIHNNRGNTLQALGQLREAVASYDKAILLQPGNGLQHYNRGNALQKMNLLEEAVKSYDQAIALLPGLAEAHNNRGNCLQKMRRHEEALVNCERAMELKPDYAEACQSRGVLMVNKGRMQEAEAMFLHAHALKPDFTMPLFSLTNIRRYCDTGHEDVRRIRKTLVSANLKPGDKEYLYFALGKIYDDCKQYEDAFAYYAQANRLRNATLGYNPAKTEAMTGAIIEVFDEAFFRRNRISGSESRAPVFVVGMPRSGTTLMASILSNHPAIATAGELPKIIEFAARLPRWTGKATPYPHGVADITPPVAAQLAALYEAELRQGQRQDIAHVVDKHPLNFRHLGFIAMLFPKATIVHCTRHPLDTAISNYFQLFSSEYDFAFDLDNIAHFHGQYARLMDHWRKVLPLTLIDVPYEDMVGCTEAVAWRLLGSLGLEWDARCLSPHTNPSTIETASQWQVRQPIYSASVARWKRYENYLGDIKARLAY